MPQNIELNASEMLQDIMPGLRKDESIVGYIIRKRDEKEARIAARRVRIARFVKRASFALVTLVTLAVAAPCVAADSFRVAVTMADGNVFDVETGATLSDCAAFIAAHEFPDAIAIACERES